MPVGVEGAAKSGESSSRREVTSESSDASTGCVMRQVLFAVLLAIAVAHCKSAAISCTIVPVPEVDDALGEALREQGSMRWLWMTWRKDADRAGAALLLKVLAAHPRCKKVKCRLKLCHAPHGLCDLLNSKVEDLDTAIVAGFEFNEKIGCSTRRLFSGVGGAPPVPLKLYRHAALSAVAENRTACLAAIHPGFFKDVHEMNACGFTTGAKPEPVPTNAAHRTELVARLRNDTRPYSFRFLDAELWGDEPRVLVESGFKDPALLVTERARLVMNGPWLLQAMRMHKPSASFLNELLQQERDGVAPGEAAVQAATEWAAANEMQFKTLVAATEPKSEMYRVLVYRCMWENQEWAQPPAVDEFTALLMNINDELENATRSHLMDIQLEPVSVDCLSRTEVWNFLQSTLTKPGAHRLLGAVAMGAGVPEAAENARNYGVPLVSYDTQVAHAALEAGARVDALVQTLRSLLAACGWQRIALLTEETQVAEELAKALNAVGPVRHAKLSRKDAELRATLLALRSEDARVFVLNAGSKGAERALVLAAKEGLTAGCAWVAREWVRVDPPPLLPLLALRGTPRDASEGGSRLLAKLWPTGRWPARAAPLADALSMLILGFVKLFDEHEDWRYDHRTQKSLESLRTVLTRSELPGVERNLTFDHRGARQPAAHVELWRPGAPLPERYEDDRRLAAACPAVRDRPRRCALPVGSAFAPRACLDLLGAVGAPALLLAALLAGRGAAALRRRAAAAARARERRLRAEVSAALLARQRDTGPALAALLVERERVTMLRALGSGRQGCVWLAELAPARDRLAAKTPHAGCSPAEEGELLREAAALAPLRHAHVVRLLGVCVGPGAPLLLTAVASHGDLLRYLRARRPPGGEASEAAHVSAAALTRLAREAALALAYLASRGIVHCDVRAANCLVDEKRELKLADFGMARSLGGSAAGTDRAAGAGGREYYACRRRALFPVLWMAPESLARGAFSPASDVWALGVLLLELVSLGARPFGALGAADAAALVARGGRARLPAAAAAETRALCRACWRREARARPSAGDVVAWLAARPTALVPAPQPDAQDGDSGFSEPAPEADRPNSATEGVLEGVDR